MDRTTRVTERRHFLGPGVSEFEEPGTSRIGFGDIDAIPLRVKGEVNHRETDE